VGLNSDCSIDSFLIVYQVPDDANDTAVLLNLLNSNCENVQDILSTLSNIHGPWSFIYYQTLKQRLWFGRDFFGRRSLLWHCPTDSNDVFAVSSVVQRCCPQDDRKLVSYHYVNEILLYN